MRQFCPDNSAILYLALIRKHHTNIFRFTVTLTEEIFPELLQKLSTMFTNVSPPLLPVFVQVFFNIVRFLQKRLPRLFLTQVF